MGQKEGQAGDLSGLSDEEIEVTDEMVFAGQKVMVGSVGDYSRETVEYVFREMVRAMDPPVNGVQAQSGQSPSTRS